MIKKIDLNLILNLYKKYAEDLKKVRSSQRILLKERGPSILEEFILFRAVRRLFRNLGLTNKWMSNINPQMDDIEAEVTYLLIREFKPKTIVEISPCGGYSTTWILNALKDNGVGRLYSYDIVDDSTKVVPMELAKGRWTFYKGDIKKNLDVLPKEIDYLFMDADHHSDFAKWYIAKIFPRLEKGIPISIDDIFREVQDTGNYGEGKVVLEWLNKNNLDFFSASSKDMKKNYESILKTKENLGLRKNIMNTSQNSMIFFNNK